MSMDEVINVLKAVCNVTCGFEISQEISGSFLITECIDRDNDERKTTYNLDEYVRNNFELIAARLEDRDDD